MTLVPLNIGISVWGRVSYTTDYAPAASATLSSSVGWSATFASVVRTAATTSTRPQGSLKEILPSTWSDVGRHLLEKDITCHNPKVGVCLGVRRQKIVQRISPVEFSSEGTLLFCHGLRSQRIILNSHVYNSGKGRKISSSIFVILDLC